jgi:S-adenosylmethionine synthetase
MYQPTAAYGHFGRDPYELTYNFKENGEQKSETATAFSWEKTDRAEALKAAL